MTSPTTLRVFTGVVIKDWNSGRVSQFNFFPFQILAAFLFVQGKKNSPEFTKNCARTLHALCDRITDKPFWPENTAFWQPTKLGGKSRTDWTWIALHSVNVTSDH